ncbi:hypothetical protein [Escherichia coli]|nr:hypothetical protein [Escherichia coli]
MLSKGVLSVRFFNLIYG